MVECHPVRLVHNGMIASASAISIGFLEMPGWCFGRPLQSWVGQVQPAHNLIVLVCKRERANREGLRSQHSTFGLSGSARGGQKATDAAAGFGETAFETACILGD